MASIVSGLQSIQQNVFNKTIIPVALETIRLFPDALVVVSGIFAILMQSLPYGIFFGSLIEATIIYRLIKFGANYANISGIVTPTADFFTSQCRSGFVYPSASMLSMSMFGEESLGQSFPSVPIYMLATASAYVFSTLSQQTKELEALGPAYSSRYYMSATLLLALLAFFMMFRVAFNCESMGVLLLSAIIGIVIGYLLVQQNLRLFGPQGINLIGIPLLRSRTAGGKKLYVCPK
jgi:hypothetical protein